MIRRSLAVFGALAVGLGVTGTAIAAPSAPTRSPVPEAPAGAARQYLIIAKGNSLPAGLAETCRRGRRNGHVDSPRDRRRRRHLDVRRLRARHPRRRRHPLGELGAQACATSCPAQVVEGPTVAEYGNPPTSGDNDTFFDLQWGHDAVDAPEAWDEGRRGAGTRVAVLDTGFDTDHPDLAPNIVALGQLRARRGRPATPWPSCRSRTVPTPPAPSARRTTASGTIGVAPETDLVLVKVLPDAGCGGDGPILAGIVYASGAADADVINMSLGAPMDKRGYLEPGCDDGPEDDVVMTASDVAEVRHAYERAVSYANAQGTTVIASAGNDASDGDHTADLIHLPGDTQGVISISATAPIGWAKAPETTFLDNLASYSNFGRSVIDFAAPGGDVLYPGEENCTVAGITRPCWVFDLVFSTGSSLAGTRPTTGRPGRAWPRRTRPVSRRSSSGPTGAR